MRRAARREGADVLFDSASEWEPLSTSVVILRAVENGVTLVKATRGAPSVVADPAGHVLAWVDPRAGEGATVVASIATRGVRTVYAAVGDVFAYACVAALALLVGGAWHRRDAPSRA